jgi:Asp-tRNA(Asn)/Glu-tRNA(Gln) amidotransferase A subunit family amidase
MSDPVDVREASIADLQSAMEQGRATSSELVQRYLDRIEAFDGQGPALNAIARVNPNASSEGRALDDERRERGPRGPLHGIPVLVKDNHDVAGLETWAGSRALEGLIAQRDAAVVARLRAAGAVVLAKTNLHELAAGITSVGSAHGRTRNPYALDRNPGGSSGGTGAGVAASLGAIGTGTDTCGSIRIPAAQNALFGLRPTHGQLASLEGIAPLCLAQDTVGPLARTAHDLALGLDAISDPSATAAGFAERLDPKALEGARIGRLDTLFGTEPEDREVAEQIAEAVARLAKLGAEVVPIEIPELPALLDVMFMMILGDVPGDLAGYLTQNPTAPVADLAALLATGRMHPEVEPVVAAAVSGPINQSDAYAQAKANGRRLRDLLIERMEGERLDALAYPPILRTAAPLGEEQLGSNAHASANSGLPAISMPAGFSEAGLPIGLELLGRPGADTDLVAYAHAWEQAEPARRPPASTPSLLGPQTD